MKIMHVSKKYPKAVGGDAVVVYNLQKQQQAAGHSVVIVSSNCDEIVSGNNIYKLGLKDTPSSLDFITPRRFVSLLIIAVRMFGILRRERPNIIHTHSIDMAFFVSFAARFFGIPIVHTFHIVTFYDPDQSLLRKKSEIWLAKKARLALATAPNKYDVTRLQAAGLKRTVLLPNGVDLAFWQSPGRPLALDNDVFGFLAVGRLEPQKGYEYLVKAAALLAKKTTSFKVIIVGEGSQKAKLKQLAQDLGVEALVDFVGGKTQEQVRALLWQANAVILASLYETTPLTLLEAWSANVPVITTPVGIIRDVPNDFEAAYVVSPHNEQSLMCAMDRCMSDPLSRQSTATKGNAEAKKYAWPNITEATEVMYRSAL